LFHQTRRNLAAARVTQWQNKPGNSPEFLAEMNRAFDEVFPILKSEQLRRVKPPITITAHAGQLSVPLIYFTAEQFARLERNSNDSLPLRWTEGRRPGEYRIDPYPDSDISLKVHIGVETFVLCPEYDATVDEIVFRTVRNTEFVVNAALQSAGAMIPKEADEEINSYGGTCQRDQLESIPLTLAEYCDRILKP